MDLNVNALVGATFLIPIAITLRKMYAPCFETPEAIAVVVAKVDMQLRHPRGEPRREPALVNSIG